MAENIGYDEISPLFYSFLKGFETFRKTREEYKSRDSNGGDGDSLKEILGIVQENEFVDNLIEKAPSKYRPFLRVAKNWPWSDTVDFISAMLKQYGKNDSGDYKTTGEVARDFFVNRLREKLFAR